MSKKKANITPADVGNLYIFDERVYRLASCETEPHAIMYGIAGDEEQLEKPISKFANFVRLKPERPIVKPVAPRKPRSDKGIPREKKPKPEQASSLISAPQVIKEPPSLTKGKRKKAATIQAQKGTPTLEEAADKKGDNLIVHVPTGIGDDVKYKVNIAGSEASGPTLRLTVLASLVEFNGKIPECLSDYERKTVQGILEAGE